MHIVKTKKDEQGGRALADAGIGRRLALDVDNLQFIDL